MIDCLPGGAAVMRQPSTQISCVAPARPSASEKAIVQVSQCPGSPKATPASVIMMQSWEMTIQARRRPIVSARKGGSYLREMATTTISACMR